MTQITRKTQVLEGIAPDAIPFAELMAGDRPAILKGVARDWPLVRAGAQSNAAAMDYLLKFNAGKPVLAIIADAAHGGRFTYTPDVSALDFKFERGALGAFFDLIKAGEGAPDTPSYYIGSTDLDIYLPGFRAENDLALTHPMFAFKPPLASIWLGNRTTALAHYDMSNNLACSLVGLRRFYLFPPEQVANLYPGPLEPTPGGQVITMADIHAPDFTRFPRLKDALASAEVAELQPGDVLFYPALWWHQVEALQSFNAMVNYWWNTSPAFMDTPNNTLLHAMLSLRDRPEHEKRGWRALFDYYIFGPSERAGEHLPEHTRGNLGPMDEMKARRLRAALLKLINR
ncbi:MAG: cupin-like domain-containing protein [Terricaulis sp.]